MNAGLFVVAQAFNRPVFSFNSWNLCCKDLLKFPKVDLPSIYYIKAVIKARYFEVRYKSDEKCLVSEIISG